MSMNCFFFFQAEDGIRDHCVTGVQTCALPISGDRVVTISVSRYLRPPHHFREDNLASVTLDDDGIEAIAVTRKIGRASCRERVEISVDGGSIKKKIGRT